MKTAFRAVLVQVSVPLRLFLKAQSAMLLTLMLARSAALALAFVPLRLFRSPKDAIHTKRKAVLPQKGGTFLFFYILCFFTLRKKLYLCTLLAILNAR